MKNKLAEEIKTALSQIEMGEYADGTPYYFGDETGSEMNEAIKLLGPLFEAYHEARMKEVTDEDIQNHFLKYAWAINKHGEIAPKIHHHIEGAKVFRDGEIKHIL